MTPACDLHCHSTFSLKDGMGTPEAVVTWAKQLKWGAACLTDGQCPISLWISNG